MQAATAQYRDQYRQRHIGPAYRGWLHFAFTVSMASAILAACALQLHAVHGWEWLTIPLTFLYANFAEYAGHRWVMHHRRVGLSKVYERHACQHHIFFTDSAMAFDSTRDFKVVLFPPVLVTFFLFAFGAPVSVLLGWLATPNVAYLFAMTGTAYFLNYELLHFAYHLPPTHPVARLPGMATLRQLHTVHHDQTLMASHNFNISSPMCDWLFGTLHLRRGN